MMELIVNVSADWGIGAQGRLLVPIRADLQRFRALTTGGTVILGRKTLETFPGGRPLKNRRNIILSTQADFVVDGAEMARSAGELFARLTPDEATFVIGGESVYRLLLPYCARARITKCFVRTPADRFFPNLDALPGWSVAGAEEPLEENGICFQYIDYVNAAPRPYFAEGGAQCTA